MCHRIIVSITKIYFFYLYKFVFLILWPLRKEGVAGKTIELFNNRNNSMSKTKDKVFG